MPQEFSFFPLNFAKNRQAQKACRFFVASRAVTGLFFIVKYRQIAPRATTLLEKEKAHALSGVVLPVSPLAAGPALVGKNQIVHVIFYTLYEVVQQNGFHSNRLLPLVYWQYNTVYNPLQEKFLWVLANRGFFSGPFSGGTRPPG